MGTIYNFCDCKNTDPRLEENLPVLFDKELLYLNTPSPLNSKKNSLTKFINKSQNDIIEEIRKKNAINLIIKNYRQYKSRSLLSYSNHKFNDNKDIEKQFRTKKITSNKKSRNAIEQNLNKVVMYKLNNSNFNIDNNNKSRKNPNILNSSLNKNDTKDIINNTVYYIGQKVNNQKNGFGIKIMSNDAKYIGFFKNNKSEGFGKFITKSDSYYGEFFNNQANGFGIYKHENETLYIGYWENDLREKYGIEKWKDRTSFYGEFNMGEKNGIGTYIFSDGSRYEGEWKNNKLEGYGIYYFPGKRIYIGEWKNNIKEGYGEFIWIDKIYIGFYLNDKKNGFGIYYWKKYQRAFMGFWKNGKQYGFGKLINKDKIIYGIWANDKLEISFKDEKEAFVELEKEKLNGYKQIFLFSLEDIINYCTNDGIWNKLLEYSNQFGI